MQTFEFLKTTKAQICKKKIKIVKTVMSCAYVYCMFSLYGLRVSLQSINGSMMQFLFGFLDSFERG